MLFRPDSSAWNEGVISGFFAPKETIAMPHNQESARATVLTPEDESQRKPLHNPISQIQLVGGVIAGLVLLLLAAVAAVVT
jgi:hypothetical protein